MISLEQAGISAKVKASRDRVCAPAPALTTNDVRSIDMANDRATALAGDLSSRAPNVGDLHQQSKTAAQPKWAAALVAAHAARKARWAEEARP